MKRIEKALRTFWMADNDIRDRVSDRIYSGRVPENAIYPNIILTTISTNRQYSVGGEADILSSIVQCHIHGDTVGDVDDIAELVRNRISGYRGTAGDESIRECTIIREDTEAKKPLDGSSTWRYRNSRDFQVFYTQLTPTLV